MTEEDRCPECGRMLKYNHIDGGWNECYECLPTMEQKQWPTGEYAQCDSIKE